jgi:hypothetical protein
VGTTCTMMDVTIEKFANPMEEEPMEKDATFDSDTPPAKSTADIGAAVRGKLENKKAKSAEALSRENSHHVQKFVNEQSASRNPQPLTYMSLSQGAVLFQCACSFWRGDSG